MKKIFLVLLVLTLFSAQKAFCWADMGHEIVGSIAEKNLTEDGKRFVREILGIEPLALAAVWPDHVRDDKRFGDKPQKTDFQTYYSDDNDFSPYHFCEIPTGYTYNNRPNKDAKDCYGVIAHSQDLLKDPKASRDEKLIALRYLIHVMGDIHQPLHIGNEYDMGGNVCKVRWMDANSKPVNLHALWDDQMVVFAGKTLSGPKTDFIYYPPFVNALITKHPEMFTEAAKAQTASGSLADWLNETANIRESGVYPDGDMSGVPANEKYKHRSYCLWFHNETLDAKPANGPINDKDIPTLTADYANKMEPVVESQLIKGGIRLASILNQLGAATKPTTPTDSEDNVQQKILKAVQDVFRNF